jgi:hypothetical protein
MVRAAHPAVAESGLSDLPEPTWRLLLARGLPQFAAEAVAPVLVFYAAWQAAGLAVAIAASSLVSLLLAAVLLRRGRDVGLVLVGAIFVLIQAAVGLASHSATVYLAQPVVLSGLWSVAYFVSAATPRPLVGVFASAWYPFPAWFKASPPFRREFRMQSVVWGVYCLARAALRLYALLRGGVGGFVLVSLVTGTPFLVALVAWGIWHARVAFARL